MRVSVAFASLLGLIVLGISTSVEAQITGLQRVASGLTNPMFVTHAPGRPNELFIAERGGAIKILNLSTGAVSATPFLTIPSVDAAGEGGLLGLTFHPDYASNGKFYVNVTIDNGGDTSLGVTSPFSNHIREYTRSANPNVANTSFNPILSFVQPETNHNGGWIGFSPLNNNNLYIATGDGGGGNDSTAGHTAGTGNAQDITNNLLGKILRVDVSTDAFPADATRNYAIPAGNPFAGATTGDDEIYAYGLRNPVRASFDRLNGNLWIGDVGQSAREEIDLLPAASSGGQNYGWRLREGLIANPAAGIGGAPPPGNVDPVYDYDRDADAFGGTVVTGGYVYRGPDPTLAGKYFFLDSRNTSSTADDNYWLFDPANPFGTVQNIDPLLVPNTGLAQFPVTFGEDALGNLYIAYLISGEVYRIQTNVVPEPTAALLVICVAPLMARRRRAA